MPMKQAWPSSLHPEGRRLQGRRRSRVIVALSQICTQACHPSVSASDWSCVLIVHTVDGLITSTWTSQIAIEDRKGGSKGVAWKKSCNKELLIRKCAGSKGDYKICTTVEQNKWWMDNCNQVRDIALQSQRSAGAKSSTTWLHLQGSAGGAEPNGWHFQNQSLMLCLCPLHLLYIGRGVW